MAKPLIAIKTRVTNYAGLVSLGNGVHAGLTANAAFTTPLPALTVLQSNIDDVTTAQSAWGTKGNRGSHEAQVTLKNAAITLSQTLKSLAQYVQNTAQTASGNDFEAMNALIVSTGFQTANRKTPQGVLQMVQNFHQFVSRKLNGNQVKLKWKKPLNTTAAGNVKSYKIYKGIQPPVFSTSAVYAVTTKTSFIDSNNTGGPQTWAYWIVPVNTNGDGAVSNSVNVTVASN